MRAVLSRRRARRHRVRRARGELLVLELCGAGEPERDDELHEHGSAGA